MDTKLLMLLVKLVRKEKKNIEKQTGYKFIDEAVSDSDMKEIKLAIRKEVSDILRDIWIKRTSWGGR
jgi:predicted transcriptional regulator